MNIAKELLETVKGKLKITWSHQDEDILDMIDEGIAFLQSRAGKLPFSLSDESDLAHLSRRLLKTYCRYDWNGSAAYFEKDYLSDLLNLQITAAVERKKSNEK